MSSNRLIVEPPGEMPRYTRYRESRDLEAEGGRAEVAVDEGSSYPGNLCSQRPPHIIVHYILSWERSVATPQRSRPFEAVQVVQGRTGRN